LENIIDLSHFIKENMPVYPGTESPVIENACLIHNCGYSELRIRMYTHTGTHLDAPAHILEHGSTLSDFSVRKFIGTALVVRYSETLDLTSDFIKSRIDLFGQPDFVLLSCGWDKFWNNPEYFTKYPVPHSSVFEYLAKLNLKGIGTDTVSIDSLETESYPNHHIILNANYIIVENLTGLEKLPDTLFEFSCFPLNIELADGSPVRAVARF